MLYLRYFSHFCLRRRPCSHSLYICPWPLCTLCIWLIKDSHFSKIRSPLPSFVERAHQYKWLTMLLTHSPTISQPFSCAHLEIFFPKCCMVFGSLNVHCHLYTLIIMFCLTFCYMPDIISVLDFWLCISQPSINLPVSVSHQ